MIRPIIQIAPRERIRLTGRVVIWPGLRSQPGDIIIWPDRMFYSSPREARVATRYGSEPLSSMMERRIWRLTISAAREWGSNPYRWVTLRKNLWVGKLAQREKENASA